MSLLVRKNLQTVLDENDMGNYHVGLSDNHTLQIVTECGRSVVAISGISFTRKSPPITEIDYAATLLVRFFKSNLIKIHKFLTSKRKLCIAKESLSTTELACMTKTFGGVHPNKYISTVEYTLFTDTESVSITYDTDLVLQKINYSSKAELPTQYKLPSQIFNKAAVIKKALEISTLYLELCEAETIYSESLAVLNLCEV